MAKYYQAKIPTDELLYDVSRNSSTLVGIGLRPGTLTAEPAGKITLGKTPRPTGSASREAVAKVADALFAAEGVKNSWLDLVDGDQEIDAAVGKVISEGIDASEGDTVHKL